MRQSESSKAIPEITIIPVIKSKFGLDAVAAEVENVHTVHGCDLISRENQLHQVLNVILCL